MEDLDIALIATRQVNNKGLVELLSNRRNDFRLRQQFFTEAKAAADMLGNGLKLEWSSGKQLSGSQNGNPAKLVELRQQLLAPQTSLRFERG